MHPSPLRRSAAACHRIALSAIASLVLCMPSSAVSSAPRTDAADDASESLRREILAMDARLSEAYAECRSQRLRALFARDAELVFAGRGRLRGAAAHLDALRREGCRQRREASAATQRIYAVPGVAGALDGAIQVGTQVFCARGAQPCRGVETDFVALWRRTDEGWKIARLIRYGYTETL